MSKDLLSWDPFAPVSHQKQQPPPPVPSQMDDDDDDEFGDFEEAPSAPIPVPTPVLAPRQAPMGHSMAKNLSPPRRKPLIQDSINDMGVLSPGQSIKFGQHLNRGSISSADWNGILGAKPGDNTHHSQGKSPTNHQHQPQTQHRPPQQARPQQARPQSRPSQPKVNTPSAFDWDDFETTPPTTATTKPTTTKASTPAPAPATNIAAFRNIPTPHQLLTYLHANCLPVMDKLLRQLHPLSFPLRKRVLAHPTTKKFIERYLDLVFLAARIMAGRMRKLKIMCAHGIEGLSEKKNFPDLMKKSDRDCREIIRVWKPLSASIGPMTNHRQLPVLQPEFLIANENVAPTQLDSVCTICGLKNTEFIRGHPKPKFNAQLNAHVTCVSWYNNLSVFGVTGVPRIGDSSSSFSGDLI